MVENVPHPLPSPSPDGPDCFPLHGAMERGGGIDREAVNFLHIRFLPYPPYLSPHFLPLLCLGAEEGSRGVRLPAFSVPQFVAAVRAEMWWPAIRCRGEAKAAIGAEFRPGRRRASAR